MPLIRNNKPSRVGLATTDGKVVYFDPGTHEIAADVIESIDTSRKDVSAYLDGAKPVIEVVDESGEAVPPAAELPEEPTPEPEKQSAADLVAKVKESDDPAWLRSLLETDDRKSVIKAADKRLAELEPTMVE